MPKKNMTPEEKKAWGEKMRKARLDKATHSSYPDKEGVTLTQEQYEALMERLSKVEESRTQTVSEPAPTSLDQFGKPVGVLVKYSIDPAHYKDPREALFSLPELQRFAVNDNYMLDWNVDQQSVDTKYGTTYLHPQFSLTLWRRIFDEQGQVTSKRMKIQTGIFFEDQAASVKEAVQMGLPVDAANTSEFLEQMRFLREKQWLLDIFFPQRLASTKQKVRDEVIGGKVYQVEEYSNLV